MFNLDYKFNKYYYDVCEPALQYDTGQKLQIRNLPKNCEAHWVYEGLPDDVDVDIRSFENGICKIPDLAFLYDTQIKCYIFSRSESQFETIAEVTIPVKTRPKPENYIVSDDVLRLEDMVETQVDNNDTIKNLKDIQGVLQKNGEGYKFLADDGTYKTVDSVDEDACQSLTNLDLEKLIGGII